MKKLLLIAIVLYIIFPLTSFAADAAAEQYVPLVIVKGLTDASTTNTNIGPFVTNLYTWVITLSITLAVIMFTYHAFGYLLSESTVTSKQKAKDGMWNVIIGLLMIFSAYLVLKTINPALVKFDLKLTPPNDIAQVDPSSIRVNCTGSNPRPTQEGVYYVLALKCIATIQGYEKIVQDSSYVLYSGTESQCNEDLKVGKYNTQTATMDYCLTISGLYAIKETLSFSYTDKTYQQLANEDWDAFRSLLPHLRITLLQVGGSAGNRYIALQNNAGQYVNPRSKITGQQTMVNFYTPTNASGWATEAECKANFAMAGGCNRVSVYGYKSCAQTLECTQRNGLANTQ